MFLSSSCEVLWSRRPTRGLAPGRRPFEPMSCRSGPWIIARAVRGTSQTAGPIRPSGGPATVVLARRHGVNRMRPLPGPPTIPRKGIDMRRLLALPITAFLALLLTGTVAAGGPNVQNISGGATIAQADWETSDANGGYTSGYAAASVEQGQSAAYLEFSQQSVTWVLCSDAGTPNDESDDVYGSVGSFSYGNGPATLTVGKSYSSASASAALDVDTFTFDECSGTKGESQS